MRGNLPGFILIVTIFQRGFSNEHSADQDGGNSCSTPGHCFVENGGPCRDDGEQKLYRWDPVKV